jgi:hypothetical protein
MAVAMAVPQQQQMVMMQVNCPPGVNPGMPVLVQGPSGAQFQVTEPAGIYRLCKPIY